MVFCRTPKVEISRRDELEMLLKVYLVSGGYLSIKADWKEQVKFMWTLDSLVNQGLIKRTNRDFPDLNGGGLTSYFVSIEDRGKEIIRKTIDHYTSLVS